MVTWAAQCLCVTNVRVYAAQAHRYWQTTAVPAGTLIYRTTAQSRESINTEQNYTSTNDTGNLLVLTDDISINVSSDPSESVVYIDRRYLSTPVVCFSSLRVGTGAMLSEGYISAGRTLSKFSNLRLAL